MPFRVRRAALAAVATSAAIAFAAGPAMAQQEPTEASPEQKAGAQVRPAVVYIQTTYTAYVFDELGGIFNDGLPYELTGSCTGFVVNPSGYVATAGHCVDTGNEGIRGTILERVAQDIASVTGSDVQAQYDFALLNYRTEGSEPGSDIDRSVDVITGAGTEGTSIPADVVDFQSLTEGDVALLKVAATDLPSVELAPDSDVAQGAPVLSIGYPGSTADVTDPSLEPTFKDGQVSSKRTVGSAPYYETSAAVSEGMSGGPTVGLDGRVVGVNSFSPAREEQAFNFIATSSRLNDLLARNNVTAELGPQDETFREGLDAYFSGDYSDAVEKFDEILAVNPDHPQALEYKTLSNQAKAQFGDSGGGDDGVGALPFIIGGGALLLVAAVIGIVLFTKRRGSRGGPAPLGAGGPGYGYPPTTPGGPVTPTPGYQQSQGFVQQGTGQPQGYAQPQVQTPPPGYGQHTPPQASGGQPAPETTMRACSRCGSPHAPGAQYCSTCGNNLA